jgi:hypothetical protein
MRVDLVAGVSTLAGCAALLVFGGFKSLETVINNRMGVLWPLLLIALLALLSCALVVRTLGKKALATEVPSDSNAGDKATAIRVAAVLSYVPALFAFGFYFSAFVFALILPPLLGKASWKAAAGFAIVLTLVLWSVFGILMRLDLPVGYLWSVASRFEWGGK